MPLTKRDIRVIAPFCVAVYVVLGLLWIWWRQGFAWSVAQPEELKEDLKLVFRGGLILVGTAGLVWAICQLGARLDRDRTISGVNQVYDTVVTALAMGLWWLLPALAAGVAASQAAEGEYLTATMWPLIVFGSASVLPAIGGVFLWFKGTRTRALFLFAFAVAAGLIFLPVLPKLLRVMKSFRAYPASEIPLFCQLVSTACLFS